MLDQWFERLSLLMLISLFTWSCASIMVPEREYLTDSEVTPKKLSYERDTVRFEVSGTIPIESVLVPKNPRVALVFRASENRQELGELPLTKKLAEYSYKESFALPYESWMEGAVLEVLFFQGDKANVSPQEKKEIARGVITTPLMAKVGRVTPDEPIPEVGLFIPTGQVNFELSKIEEYLLLFDAGSSELKMNSRNSTAIAELKNFINENPDVRSIKVTGIQSPEQAEGKSSKLGMDRAFAAQAILDESGLLRSDSIIETNSRWNDWFDFRLLLRDYDQLSTQRKDQYYAILLENGDYQSQATALRKIPGFNQLAADLFPKLRSVKIEIKARPFPGLDQEKSAKLARAIQADSTIEELELVDWAIAGESSPRLEDKETIYSKMTELFRSAIPYTNLAVVKMRMAQRTLDIDKKEKLWDEAEWLLSRASFIESTPYVLHNQGQIMALRGDFWPAYKKLSDASVMTKDQDFLRKNEGLRGALDIIRGDFKLATLRFQYPYSDPVDFFNKGLAYYLAKDFANASLSFEESVMAGRNYGYGFYGLAMIASQSGQDEVALIQLERAISTSEVLYQKALVDPVFEELREKDEFFEIFRNSNSSN